MLHPLKKSEAKMKASPVKLAVYVAIVYSVTVLLQIYQPATGGYFNLGEAAIYVIALSSTPLIAGLAGGIGSFLADITTGYGIFAPGTMIIKFAEGYIASYLSKRLTHIKRKETGMLMIFLYISVFSFLTVRYLAGQTMIGPVSALWERGGYIVAHLPILLWVTVSIVLLALSLIFLIKGAVGPGCIISLIVSGSIMVLGYFLYEYFLTNPLTGRNPIDAIWEIPINVTQVAVGISVAIPLIGWLRRARYLEPLT